MRFSSLAAPIGVPTLCLAIVLSAFSPVLADGLSSQWKTRLPQGAPVTDTLVAGTMMPIQSERSTITKREADLIATTVRRNARAAQRRAKWAIVSPVKTNAISAKAAPSKPLSETDRARLIVKNYKVATTKCGGLHTHERATCMYNMQREMMVQSEGTR